MVNYRDSKIYFIFSTTFLAIMGVALIAPGLPTIRKELGLDQAEIGLMVTFFTVPGMFFAPFVGTISDKFGRKEILTPSLLLFGITGSLCAVTDQFELLLFLRGLQGIGGAGLLLLTNIIIGDLYINYDRTEVLGRNGSVQNFGMASYPVIGGILTVIFGWYAPYLLFLLTIPLGLLMWKFLDIPQPKRSSQSIGEYLRGAIQDLQNRDAIVALLAGLGTFALLFGPILTYLGEFLSQEFQTEANMIGLVLSATSMTAVIVSFQIRWFAQRWSPSRIFVTGFTLFGISLIMIPFLPTVISFFVVSFIFGTGQGMIIPIILSQILKHASPERRGIVVSLLSAVLRTGQSFGPFIFGLLLLQFTLGQVFALVGAFILLVSIPPLVKTFLTGKTEREAT
ncbi:MAG: MFS transporter [Candidatus Hodarchaeales archaeon]